MITDQKHTAEFLMGSPGETPLWNDLLQNISNLPKKKDLNDLSKEDLVCKIRSIQNLVNAISGSKKNGGPNSKNDNFDFKRYKKRHVALKFLYLGWDYCGFTVQENTDKTIEACLFKALLKTKLVESRETSNYHRCGRTDKGVSAFSQVISLDLRSNLLEGSGIITPEGYSPSERKTSDKELDYVGILNQVLPHEIRVLAWAPVEPGFSARFDCIQRTYKYWFPKADLDIERMRLAGQRLVGEHDFRNFCKLDVGNGVLKCIRRISEVRIAPFLGSEEGEYQMMEITITGSSFLWHQIRCIVTVLILVGQGKESAEVVSQLLDVKTCPKKPQYGLASELPLVLFDCQYDNVDWLHSEENLKPVVKQLQALWVQQAAKSTIIGRMLTDVEGLCSSGSRICHQAESLLTGEVSRVHKRLLERPVCESLEDRIVHYAKKQKNNHQLNAVEIEHKNSSEAML